MIKCFREALGLAYENLICISPLLLFMIAISLYLNAAKISVINIFSLCTTILTLIIMFALFLSGWFYMIKMAIINARFNMLNLKKDFELLKQFPTGVADYFIPFIYLILFSLVLLGIVYGIDFIIGAKFIGTFGIEAKDFTNINELSNFENLFTNLTYFQIIKASGWIFLFTVSTLIYVLFTLMWIPYLMFRTKNIFKALFYSISDVFTSPKILTLLLNLIMINFIFALINSYIRLNPILFFLSTMIYIFFIVYTSMLIFLYYDKKYTYENDEKQQS